MTSTIDGDSFETQPTTVTNADSPYTTQGEQYIYADSSGGAVTVELASADVVDGKEFRIIDSGLNAGTNTITVTTEGSETFNPGGASSITLTVDGTYVDLFSDGSNWFSDRASEKQSVSAEDGLITETLDSVESDTLNYRYHANTMDGVQELQSGSGDAVAEKGVRVLLSVDANAGDFILAEDQQFQSWNYPTWGKQRKCRISFWIENTTEDFGFGTGRVNVNNLNQSHIGCYISGGVLYASVGSDDQSDNKQVEIRNSVNAPAQHEVFVDFDGNPSGNGTATVTVREYPIDGGTTPNYEVSHTFDAGAGDPIPQGKESAQAFGWTAWSAMLATPNGTATDVHLNQVDYVLYPDAA